MASIGQDYVGSYRLLNLVRMGKTCQVWEAIHDARRERVAVKLVRPEFQRDREQIAMMKHEYTVGHSLDHPHVIHILDFVSDSTKTFVTMEYFDAPNMKQWIYQGVDSIAHLLPQVIQQASEGMAYLHKQGYVHRDIKPDNFLMDNNGQVKLIDFALCVKKKGLVGRLLGGRGKVQGTRSYMSPEQIRGQALDERADIYSFGCTLYELLSGRPPFTGVSTNDLLTKHLRTPPPSLEASNRNVTSQFGQLVRRMLAKDPAARPQTMDDVVRELKSIPILKTVPAPPA